jgi:hypothetical protein
MDTAGRTAAEAGGRWWARGGRRPRAVLDSSVRVSLERTGTAWKIVGVPGVVPAGWLRPWWLVAGGWIDGAQTPCARLPDRAR